jgi:hypothetical protein
MAAGSGHGLSRAVRRDCGNVRSAVRPERLFRRREGTDRLRRLGIRGSGARSRLRHWSLAAAARRERNSRRGLDASSQMLAQARAQVAGAGLALGRAENLPWAGQTFDRVFCINAFHHFQDQIGASRPRRDVAARRSDGRGTSTRRRADPQGSRIGRRRWRIVVLERRPSLFATVGRCRVEATRRARRRPGRRPWRAASDAASRPRSRERTAARCRRSSPDRPGSARRRGTSRPAE